MPYNGKSYLFIYLFFKNEVISVDLSAFVQPPTWQMLSLEPQQDEILLTTEDSSQFRGSELAQANNHH